MEHLYRELSLCIALRSGRCRSYNLHLHNKLHGNLASYLEVFPEADHHQEDVHSLETIDHIKDDGPGKDDECNVHWPSKKHPDMAKVFQSLIPSYVTLTSIQYNSTLTYLQLPLFPSLHLIIMHSIYGSIQTCIIHFLRYLRNITHIQLPHHNLEHPQKSHDDEHL